MGRTKHVSVDVYTLNLFIEICLFTSSQVFWWSSAPGALSTPVTSVVLYSLTRVTLMSLGRTKHVSMDIYALNLLTVFCSFTTPQVFWQSSAPGALSTLVTSVVLYSLTRARAFWRILMKTEYFLFVHHTTSILAKLSTWCFEHSGDISCSLLVNPSHSDESWEGQNTCMWIYMLWIYSLSTLESTDENRIFFVRSPQHKHFGKAQHLVLWALWWHQLFSTR